MLLFEDALEELRHCFIPLSFSLDVYNLKEDAAVFTGKRALISFLSWLDYCDQLIKEAQKVRKSC